MAALSRQTKTEKCLLTLLNALKQREKLSITDIQSVLNCNRQSAYNYINRLVKDRNYNLKREIIKNKVYYSLDPSSKETINYVPLTVNILRKYQIIRAVQQYPNTKHMLWKKMSEDDASFPLIDFKMTSYYKLIDELENEGEIAQRGKQYYPTGKSIPLVLTIQHDKLDYMLVELSNIFPGHPYYSQLHSVYQKIQLMLGNIDYEDSAYENYIIYGRKYIEVDHISSQLRKIEGYDYKSKMLEVVYTPLNQEPISLLFGTGMIVYCLEKDALYLLGQNTNTDVSNEEYLPQTIINVNTINSITETNAPNPYYLSDSFREIFETMFSISIAPPINVKVIFDRTKTVEREICHLKAQRRYADIQLTKECIIYTDRIRGLPDFINYLRQFGDHIRDVEPAAIKDALNTSVNRSLQRYLEEKCDE